MTKFVIASREVGCSNCNNLKAFLQYGLDSKYENDITFVTKESNSKEYDELIDKTGAMGVPVIFNTENDKWISGFNPPEIQNFLSK